MANVLRVLARDIKRLLTTPATWAVILFLMVLPSLYAWFNVAGFWNPYDNTGNLRVCVVNEDEGAQIEGIGELNLGNQVSSQLADNDQLGWEFVTREAAAEEVRTGSAYAAFVMPADFSANVATILSGDFHQPRIEYYVNEKTGPVAPKITDTGASSLDATINEAFVSAVSEAAAAILDEKLNETASSSDQARSKALSHITAAREGIANARRELAELAETAQGTRYNVTKAESTLDEARAQLEQISHDLILASTLSGNASSSLVRFTSSAASTLDAASQKASQASTRTSNVIAADATAVAAAKGSVDAGIARGRAVAQETAAIATLLAEMEDELSDADAKAAVKTVRTRIERANEAVNRNLNGLETLSSDMAKTAAAISGAFDAADTSVQQTLEAADGLRDTLNASIVPALSSALVDTSHAASDLSAQTSSQQALIDEADTALGVLSNTLDTAVKALSSTGDRLGGTEDELSVLENDVASLGGASAITQLIGDGRIDPAQIAEFMMSPTRLETEQLYPLNAYGSAMAPLFVNLTLWIGVFMLMVIIRLEVDDEGIERLTVTQRFLGRLLLLAPLACIQAIICCTGCLWIGVQSASIPAFYATAVMASLAYLAIQYTLSTTFQHVGKAICIILVFVQIPGATGLYPIEMTPAFFRAVYPLFPFTYGINAIREAISGFYGTQWIECIGVLIAFMVVFLIIGIVSRSYLTNLNRMFAREIEESDIIVGESVELPARRWRGSQVLRALANRDEYRVALERRVSRFMAAYPLIKRSAYAVGATVPLFVGALMLALGADKAIVLTFWLAWLIAFVTLLIALEFLRDSLSHQVSLEGMGDDEVRGLIGSRDLFTSVKPLTRDITGNSDSSSGKGGGR